MRAPVAQSQKASHSSTNVIFSRESLAKHPNSTTVWKTTVQSAAAYARIAPPQVLATDSKTPANPEITNPRGHTEEVIFAQPQG